MADAFGSAIRDLHRDERDAPLIQRDGEESLDHPIEAFYFGGFHPEGDERLTSRLRGPLVDPGAGAGRHALAFQQRFETVAVESSPALVETMRERGVDDPREGDMFALREASPRDRFEPPIAIGAQVGLAGSMRSLSAFLGDLARVTTPTATAMVGRDDPDHPDAADLLGYRSNPTPGLAGRVMCFDCEGDRDPIRRMRLFGPDRLREVAVGTGRADEAVDRDGSEQGPPYRAALKKR